MNIRSRPDWPTIKQAYFNGEGSLRELAKRFQVCFSTLGKRSGREGWYEQRERLLVQLDARTKIAALEAAEQRGKELGMNQTDFVARTIGETEGWLDRIQKLANVEPLDADKLKTLLESWRVTIREGRAVFKLDAPPEEPKRPLVHVNLMANVGGPRARELAPILGITYPANKKSEPFTLPATTSDPGRKE